jgi:hypothetical protein
VANLQYYIIEPKSIFFFSFFLKPKKEPESIFSLWLHDVQASPGVIALVDTVAKEDNNTVHQNHTECAIKHNILEPTTGVTFFNTGSKSDPT